MPDETFICRDCSRQLPLDLIGKDMNPIKNTRRFVCVSCCERFKKSSTKNNIKKRKYLSDNAKKRYQSGRIDGFLKRLGE